VPPTFHAPDPKHRFAVTADGESGLRCLYAGCEKFFEHTRKHLRAISTLIANDLPVSLMMQAAEGPLVVRPIPIPNRPLRRTP
jgi:uncharacterized protein